MLEVSEQYPFAFFFFFGGGSLIKAPNSDLNSEKKGALIAEGLLGNLALCSRRMGLSYQGASLEVSRFRV